MTEPAPDVPRDPPPDGAPSPSAFPEVSPPHHGLAPQHGVVWALLGLAVFCLIGAATLRRYTQSVENLEVLGRVENFELTDQHGQKLRSRDLRGRVWVASFIFTRCPGPCPVITSSVSHLDKLLAQAPDIRIVSFSMDPEFDTPEILTDYAKSHDAVSPRWQFVTGSKQAIHDITGQFKLALEDPKTGQPETLIHSEKLVLVDRLGRIRGYYPGVGNDSVKMLAEDAQRLNAAAGVTILPTINASLNGLAALLLIAGGILVKMRRYVAHRNVMITAGFVSGLFLASYLMYHMEAGSMPFRGEGGVRTLYFAILISHVLLAAVVAVLAPITFWRGLGGQWSKHKRIARITYPIWLYVSITGVVVYVMLYHMYVPTL